MTLILVLMGVQMMAMVAIFFDALYFSVIILAASLRLMSPLTAEFEPLPPPHRAETVQQISPVDTDTEQTTSSCNSV